MTYRQLTSGERYLLSALRRQGLHQAAIARQLGRHRSTIGRELQRNGSCWDGGYRPSVAIERTSGRRSRSRRNHRFTPTDLRRVDALLRQQWSPEQVSGYLRRHRLLSISHETIYRHVWRKPPASIERALGVQFYFATPHHAWERGTSENTNGLVRQYVPKDTSMADLTRPDCSAIAAALNTRPRNRLDYKTPQECFDAY